MTCIDLVVALLSLSACHPQSPPRRLPGVWVGTLEAEDGPRFVRAEFVPARAGMTGTLHLPGVGDMTLVRASENDGSVGFAMRRGDDELIFLGAFRAGVIVGRAHHAGGQARLELQRAVEIDRRHPPRRATRPSPIP
jgi:hypothetical protein